MATRTVEAGWSDEFLDALRADATELRVVCPFIKVGGLDALLQGQAESIRVITRYNLADFAEGVSDIGALRRLLKAGAAVRGIRGLHSKLYLFGETRAIVTSANLTTAALSSNREFGVVSEDPAMLDACRAYFDQLWALGRVDLRPELLERWDSTVSDHLAMGGRHSRSPQLGDFGEGGVLEAPTPTFAPRPELIADAPQAFVRFLGTSGDRATLSGDIVAEIESSHCHWAVANPKRKRPTGVQDGAIMFISRLVHDSEQGENDIRIFGRAIGIRHDPDRDNATDEDVRQLPWKRDWCRYIRVHHAEFVAGTFENGVSLNELMDTLTEDSFASTRRNAATRQGNTNPRNAYLRQPGVELSEVGYRWLNERLNAAFKAHGAVPQDTLASIYWPYVPGLEIPDGRG